jgi:hypothetical protein
LQIDEAQETCSINGKRLRAGDLVTLDGSTGSIYEGEMNLVTPTLPDEYYAIMKWSDERRRLGVRTNADTPYDAEHAVRMGAEGIKVKCGGRLGGAEIARVEGYREGRVPLHTLRADIDYGFSEAKTTYGIIGIKVWVNLGDQVAETVKR